VRDVADIANPVTVASLGDKFPWADKGLTLDARIVDPSTLAWRDGTTGALVQSAANGPGLKTLVASNGVISFAWSPVSGVWTYLINTQSALEWHLVSGANDRVLASLPPIPAHGGVPRLEPTMVTFSADGNLVAMTDSWSGEIGGSGDKAKMQIRKADGTLLASSGEGTQFGGPISDLLWVGSSLLFRDYGGIEVWNQTGVCSALPGVEWIRPKLSPDGKLVVFHAGEVEQHVYVLDLITGKVKQVSPADGAEGWFLGSGYVWFLEQRLCAANESCGMSRARFTGQTYIVNVASGTTSESRITRIADTWPRLGAPNFDNIWWQDAAARW
jgi:hypothetical protein